MMPSPSTSRPFPSTRRARALRLRSYSPTPHAWHVRRRQEAWLRGRSVKAWANWAEVLSDHRIFAQQWLTICSAYVGPNALEPQLA